MENLKHIFGVPEEVEKARQLIKDGQLLEVSSCTFCILFVIKVLFAILILLSKNASFLFRKYY